MSEDSGKHVRVFVNLPGKGEVRVGTLFYDRKDELGRPKAEFAYFPLYKGPPIDPINLPLPESSNRIKRYSPPPSDDPSSHLNLHQVFQDTMPGGWGDRVLADHYPEYGKMNAAEKLFWLGSRSANGLRLECYSSLMTESPIRGIDRLREIEQKSVAYLEFKRSPELGLSLEEVSARLKFLKAHDGSLWAVTSEGGARPKAKYQARGKEYLAKFNEPFDDHNVARLEHSMLCLSARAGLTTARSGVIRGRDGASDIFICERFDRQDGMSLHKITFAALVGERNTGQRGGVDYSDMVQVLRQSGSNVQEDVEELYGRMLMAVYCNLTDNHLRNYEMMLGQDGGYHLAPHYDLIPDPSDSRFATSICGYPRRDMAIRDMETSAFFDRTAQKFGLDPRRALAISERVLTAMAEAPAIMRHCGVPEKDASQILQMMDLSRLEQIRTTVQRMRINRYGPDEVSFSEDLTRWRSHREDIENTGPAPR